MSVTFDEGTYKAKITDWGLAKARTGNMQIVIKFKPLGMIDQSEPEGRLQSCPDYERSVYRVITDKTIDFVLEDLTRLGYDKNGFEFLDRNHDRAHDFEGQEIEVQCKHDVYQGKQQEKWELSRGVQSIKNADASEVQKLNAMFGKHLAKLSKNPPAPRKADGSEDIPF